MKILETINIDLKKKVDQKYKEGSIRYFKEKIKVYGVRAKIVDQISKKYWQEIKQKPKHEIFFLCEELLKSGFSENISIALDWTYRLKKNFQESDFKIFMSWLKKYISNWASDDDLCTHSLGYLIFKFPGLLPELKQFAFSKNRWERRASAVTLIYPIKNNKNLTNVLETAKILLQDKDDLVQKGYGWMLKVASQKFPKEVLKFVNQNKTKMPRTALRYAIEKYPQNVRKQILNS